MYLIALFTIVRKEIRRFTRIWLQTLVPPAITTSLYLLIFGGLIGSRVGDMGGRPYMEYIIPGVIMLAVITSSYANVVSSFFGAKFQHYVEELLVAPVPNSLILAGYVAGGMVRGLCVGLVVTAITFLLVDFRIVNYPLTLLVVGLASGVFSLAGFINAIFAKSFDDISIVPTFVLTPLTYLGGIFYSIELLPEFWRDFSLLNPILYMVNAFRYGMLGVSDIDLWQALLLMLIFFVGLAVIGLLLLNKGIGLKT